MKIHFTKSAFIFSIILLIVQFSFSQAYIWGGPGDKNSEFNGGLNDWTVKAVSPNDSAKWTWTSDGKADRGSFWADADAGNTINSASFSNGAAVFDSDYYDNGGDYKTNPVIHDGLAISPQISELISPVFSCEKEESVWVYFHEYYKHFDATTKLAVSIDGGENWLEPIIINSDVAQMTSINDKVLVDISKQDSKQANVKIKFIFDGDYYFWIVDDVSIISNPVGDPQILGTWYPSIHYEQPLLNIKSDSMMFVMDFANKGGSQINNCIAKVTLYNVNSGRVYYQDSTKYDLDADINRVYFNSYQLPCDCDTGLYIVDYFLVDNGFATNTKKRHQQYFHLSPPKAEPYGYNKSIIRNTDDNLDDYWGNDKATYNISYYKMPDWVKCPRLRISAISTEFTILFNNNENIPVSYQADVFMLELNDSIDNNLLNFDFYDKHFVDDESTQTSSIGYGSEFIENISNGSDVTVPLYDLHDNAGIPLKPNGKYFIANYWPGGNSYYQACDNHNDNGDLRYYYSYDNLIVNGDTMIPQMLSLTYSPADSRYYIPTGVSENDTITLCYKTDLNLKLTTPCPCTVSTSDQFLPDDVVIFEQNPIINRLVVDINFKNTQDKVSMIITDVNGTIIELITLKDIKSKNQVFNLSYIPAGIYNFSIFTTEKALTKKFIVIK